MAETLPRSIYEVLVADPALTGTPVGTQGTPAGALGFTPWTRWLDPQRTPEAFRMDVPGKPLKRNIVILDAGEPLHPGTQHADGRRGDHYVTTHVIAEAHENGKKDAIAAYLRMERLLTGREMVISGGRVGYEQQNERLVLEDSPEWPGNVVVIVRWRFTGSRAMVPA